MWCFRDITEKLASQEALSAREELFRSLIENASDAVTMLSADGTSLYESPSVERVLGYPPEEILGTKSFSLLHPDDHEAVQQTFAAMLAGEEPMPIEVRLRHRDGNWRTVEAIGRRRSPGWRVGRRRQLPGRHRSAPAAGAAPARAEARVDRAARRRCRARLQQSADCDRRLQRVPRGRASTTTIRGAQTRWRSCAPPIVPLRSRVSCSLSAATRCCWQRSSISATSSRSSRD